MALYDSVIIINIGYGVAAVDVVTGSGTNL